MTKPNSRITRFRIWLSRKLDPYPDAGEAWCIKCSLNDRKNVVLSAEGVDQHDAMHQQTPGNHTIWIRWAKSSR